MREDILQRLVLLQQLQRGFFADAGNAGNIVRVVAHQTLEVAHAVWFKTVLFLKNVPVELDCFADALLGQEHVRMFVDELERVAVTGDEQRVNLLCFAKPRERAQYIVRFVARRFADGNAHLLEQFFEQRKLRAEVFLRLLAPRFVLRILVVPKGRPVHVERDDEIIRISLNELEQHADEAMQRARWRSRTRRHGRQRVVCTMHEAVSVDCYELFQARSPCICILLANYSVDHRRDVIGLCPDFDRFEHGLRSVGQIGFVVDIERADCFTLLNRVADALVHD